MIVAVHTSLLAVDASLVKTAASLAKMAACNAATEAKLLTAPTRIGCCNYELPTKLIHVYYIGNTLARGRETGGIVPTVTFTDSSGTTGLAVSSLPACVFGVISPFDRDDNIVYANDDHISLLGSSGAHMLPYELGQSSGSGSSDYGLVPRHGMFRLDPGPERCPCRSCLYCSWGRRAHTNGNLPGPIRHRKQGCFVSASLRYDVVATLKCVDFNSADHSTKQALPPVRWTSSSRNFA
jgi:hypothetical protein